MKPTGRPRTHGEAACVTREYRAWASAKSRCFNPRHQQFPRYGARGISMCRSWRASYEAFLRDMGRCPEGHSLDRVDVNGHYEPENCRWATTKQQNRNRTVTHWIEFSGERMALGELAERLGVPSNALHQALKFAPLADVVARVENGRIRPKATWSRAQERRT